jgi:hypothetical protein
LDSAKIAYGEAIENRQSKIKNSCGSITPTLQYSSTSPNCCNKQGNDWSPVMKSINPMPYGPLPGLSGLMSFVILNDKVEVYDLWIKQSTVAAS